MGEFGAWVGGSPPYLEAARVQQISSPSPSDTDETAETEERERGRRGNDPPVNLEGVVPLVSGPFRLPSLAAIVR